MKGIGSLPWFAGVFWLGVAGVLHGAAVAVYTWFPWAVARVVTPPLAGWSTKASKLALKCAGEAGLTEEKGQ